MSQEQAAPASSTTEAMPDIPMAQVQSNQVAAIGYDSATKTLAVTFTRGTAVYHYPNVEPEVHQKFMAAESIGKFFGQHIKALPFAKYTPPKDSDDTQPAEATGAAMPAAPPPVSRAPWPFPTAR